MQNDHKTQDPGRSFGRSDDREKLATWPASLVSELAENRRVRLELLDHNDMCPIPHVHKQTLVSRELCWGLLCIPISILISHFCSSLPFYSLYCIFV